VLTAARDLFVDQGYGRTTIEEIAARAGVSKPTVFNAVGNKQTLLCRVRDTAIAGDDDPVPVSRRPSTEQIRDEPDRGRAIELLARHLTAVARRYGLIYEQLRATAAHGEEDLRQLWETEERERLIGASHWVDVLRSKRGGARSRGDLQVQVDTVWFLMAPDNYNRLVRQRGWSERRYEQWLAAEIAQAIEPGRSRQQRE